MLTGFAAFFYLNIWPLCTVGGYPYDFSERATFRPRAVALTVSGVIVPLFIPRPFRSSTKKDRLQRYLDAGDLSKLVLLLKLP